MTPERVIVEAQLQAWAKIFQCRDLFVLQAYAAGLSRHRIHTIMGLSRPTINRIINASQGKLEE